MQWEPLGTTSQYKQLVLITHVKIACYLITWASFHPEKHITALCSHHLCLSSFTGFGLSLLISQEKKQVWAKKKEELTVFNRNPHSPCLCTSLPAPPPWGIALASDVRLLIAALPFNFSPLFSPVFWGRSDLFHPLPRKQLPSLQAAPAD